jgi:hypothetical protein
MRSADVLHSFQVARQCWNAAECLDSQLVSVRTIQKLYTAVIEDADRKTENLPRPLLVLQRSQPHFLDQLRESRHLARS